MHVVQLRKSLIFMNLEFTEGKQNTLEMHLNLRIKQVGYLHACIQHVRNILPYDYIICRIKFLKIV